MAKIITADYYLDLEHPSLDNMSDDEFFNFCVQNKNINLERDENHQILIMPPAGNETSAKNVHICVELELWNRKTKAGIVFDSSAGFYLPDTSMRNPDAAWISNDNLKKISLEERKKFSYIAPDFIIELMSPSDNLKQAKEKMEKWIKNGVKLAWLIYPQKQTAFIYKANGTVEEVTGFDNKLSGEDVLQGFQLDLSILK